MLKSFIFIFLVIISAESFSQILDSSKINSSNVVSIIDSTKLIPDSLSVNNDTLGIHRDSLKTIVDSIRTDSIRALQKRFTPIQSQSFSENNYTLLSSNEWVYNDYRFTGDFLSRFSLGFIKDLGVIGQPNEVLLYGSGYNSISFFNNGQLINSRLTNSFDVNNIQTEALDSIEILPSVRGFIFGPANNEAAINFIPKESFDTDKKKTPYSRLRYYQAPNEEAMIDAIVRAWISRRLIVLAEMTNKSIDQYFPNSDYSSWKFKINTRYLLSDIFNFSADYNYSKSEVGLFGGFDIDSLNSMAAEPSSNIQYPVRFRNRYQKFSNHNLNFSLRNQLHQNLFGNMNLYYSYQLQEYRQNEYKSTSGLDSITNDNKIKTFGFTIREIYNPELLKLDLSAGYEYNNLKAAYFSGTKNIHTAYVSGIGGLILFDNIRPSVFYKNLFYDEHLYIGFGADVNISLTNNFHLYAGLSQFDKPVSPVEEFFVYPDSINSNYRIMNQRKTIRSAEAGLNYSDSTINSEFKLFTRDITGESFPILNPTDRTVGFTQEDVKISGAGLKIKLELWKLLVDLNSSYYYYERSSTRKYFLPEYTFTGGIYYKDILFKNNLKLKTGFTLCAGGRQDFYFYDFEKNLSSSYFIYSNDPIENKTRLKSYSQLDFVLIGEIQRRAILYITFENLLDKKYYIVPFHQKQGRGLRIGVAWEFLN